MSLTTLFDTIHEFHCTISTSFYIYLQYFQLAFTFIYSIFNKKFSISAK